MILFQNRMLFTFLLLVVAGIVASEATVIQAATIYESGTLGPTGVTWDELTSQTVPGTNVNGGVFTGVRFQVTQFAVTTELGGHFVAAASGTFFGAIVALNDEKDCPDSGDLSTPDVLGATLLAIPTLSDEVFGDIALSLEPGWYALVFGSGLFGATTNGGVVRNGIDIGDNSYIGYQPSRWRELSPFFDNHRFVVEGRFVPEPTTMTLVLILGAFVGTFRTCRHPR